MSSAQNQADGAADGGDTVSFAVMLAVVLVLFLVVVFVFFFYLYAKRRMGRSSSLRSYSRTRFGLASGHVAPHPGGGLDAAVLSSLPVTVYRAAKYKEGVECAVCLTELSDGEKARLLPMCNHGFHLACIDMWFRSHATCPLCRAPVASQPAGVQGSDGPAESAQAPNTSETVPESLSIPSGVISPRQGPSGYAGSSVPETPAGAIVIEIQSREPEGTLSPLPPSRPAREEAKTPALSSLKSLTRILSRGKPVAGPSLSPTAADIEQGYRESAPTPKALNHPRGRPWQNWLRRAYIS